MAKQGPNPRKRGSRRGKERGGGRGGGSRRTGRATRGKAGGRKPADFYYMQPGKRGTVVVLHRPVGNRASPKVCGVMPSRNHAQALVDQLRKAESALHDLFYEATDDGIEALEAILAASRDAVFTRLPPEDGTGLTIEEMASERERIQRELDMRAPARRSGQEPGVREP